MSDTKFKLVMPELYLQTAQIRELLLCPAGRGRIWNGVAGKDPSGRDRGWGHGAGPASRIGRDNPGCVQSPALGASTLGTGAQAQAQRENNKQQTAHTSSRGTLTTDSRKSRASRASRLQAI